MKSRICFCNGTILKKDLTRFAPVMISLTIFLAFTGWSMKTSMDYLVEDGIWTFQPVQVFHNFGMLHAVISGICLFSYLTRKKECDAMHALPVRRETFFFTHLLAALIQWVIPFAILYLVLPGDRGWGFQMFFTACSWLFWFGLMVFCMMLTGRKIAAVILFGLLSDIVSTFFMMLDALYIPLLPGIYLDQELLYNLSPSTHMNSLDFTGAKFTELLLPMGLYALGGIALLVISLLFYRKRKMERAGDFLAEKWLEPVFAWGLGISIACTTVSMGYLMDLTVWAPLIIGLAIGYFAALMLFARSIKVFNKKTLAGFGALVGFIGATVFIVSMDPMGAVSRIPQTEQIESVTFADYYGHNYGGFSGPFGYTTSDPEEMDRLRSLHQELIEQEQLPDVTDEEYWSYEQFYLTYTLKDGSEIRRCYYVTDEALLDEAEYFLSQPENLLGVPDLETLILRGWDVQAQGMGGDRIYARSEFFEVLMADCEAGNMYEVESADMSIWTVSLRIDDETGASTYFYIDVPKKAEATVVWLEEHFG